MFLTEIFESNERRLVVVYPGRFQPFHQGHAAVFAQLQGKFGRDNVWIATNPNVKIDARSPFNLAEKVALMHAAGVTDDRIAKTTNPYLTQSCADAIGFDPANTVVIFAVGEPDRARLEVDAVYTQFTPTGRPSKIPDGKQVGDDKYYKSFKNFADCTTSDQHGYVVIVPEVNKTVTINGKKYNASHGTDCRNLWNQIRGDEPARQEFLTQLYGRATSELEHIFDKIPSSEPTPEPKARPTKLAKTATAAGGVAKPTSVEKQAKKANPLIKEMGGVGVVRSTKDPRYVMSQTVDVDGDTLGNGLDAYHLTGKYSPDHRQQKVKKNIGKG
jgi:hypothetical protein